MDDRYVAFYVIGEEHPRYIKIKEEVVKNFKFKHQQSTNGLTFKALHNPTHRDYTVMWTDNNGYNGSTTYSEATVESCLRNGSWILIEDIPAQQVQTAAHEDRDGDVLVAEQADDAAGSFFIGGWCDGVLESCNLNSTPAEPYISLKEVQEFAKETLCEVKITFAGTFRVKADFGTLEAESRDELVAMMDAVRTIQKARRPWTAE